jgi:hypothetical protein
MNKILNRYVILHLAHTAPESVRLIACPREVLCAARSKSPKPANTNPHLNNGAQKNMVVGPNEKYKRKNAFYLC